MKDWQKENDETIVCQKRDINKKSVVNAIQGGCDSLEALERFTDVCAEKECCLKDLIELLAIYSIRDRTPCTGCGPTSPLKKD